MITLYPERLSNSILRQFAVKNHLPSDDLMAVETAVRMRIADGVPNAIAPYVEESAAKEYYRRAKRWSNMGREVIENFDDIDDTDELLLWELTFTRLAEYCRLRSLMLKEEVADERRAFEKAADAVYDRLPQWAKW